VALADFSLITFTGAVAVANGKLGSISQFPHLQMMMQRSDSTLLAAPSGAVLLLSQYVETTHALKLLERGAGRIGYQLKDRVSDVGEFTDAVRRVASGGSAIDPDVVAELVSRRRWRDLVTGLTDREREVLKLMAERRSNSAIGSALHLSDKTVEGHVRSIFMKFELEPTEEDHRRVLAVLAYLRA